MTGASLAAAFQGVSTASLATVLSQRGIQKVFMYGVGPLPGSRPHMVGRAFTMRAVAAREDMLLADKAMNPRLNLQRRAAEECGKGEVLVIDCRGDARGASGGLILFERMRVRGCAGVVSDGGVRDAADIVETGFPVYSRAVCPPNSLVSHRFVDLQVPVTCGDAAVYPGDVIVGDPDGVIVVPAALADEVAVVARELELKEQFIIARIRAGSPVYGTYPLEAPLLDEFTAWRAQQ